MHNNPVSIALADISGAFKQYYLVAVLGWQDIRQRYRRSTLGPFWLTISMGVMIGSIGFVFGHIFETPMREFLPFLATGLIFWNFISNTISEGCTGFIDSEGIIKQLPIPLFVYILRLIWRNLIILGHNVVILPIVFIAVGKSLSWLGLVSILGAFIAALNLTWIALLLSVFCTRYRDLPQIITSIMQVVFYLTPVIWMPDQMKKRTGITMMELNPFYHLIDIVRAPILGQPPTTLNWIVSIIMAIIGWSVTILIYGCFKRRIAYWL